MNATVTVTYDGESVTFELEGAELSEIHLSDTLTNRYLNNASRSVIADEVEKALLHLAHGKALS